MTQFTQETASDSIARFSTPAAISAKLTTAVLLQMASSRCSG